jgi:hypothetical protein
MKCPLCGFAERHPTPEGCIRDLDKQLAELRRYISHLEKMMGIQAAEQAPVCVECRSRSAAWGAGTMCYDCQANRYYNPQPSV